MVQFVHPAQEDITLSGLLFALADPMRIRILQSLLKEDGCPCCQAIPSPKMAKSTLSHHFRVLREAGLIRTTKIGVQHRNKLRLAEVNERFPGLLKAIMKFSDK